MKDIQTTTTNCSSDNNLPIQPLTSSNEQADEELMAPPPPSEFVCPLTLSLMHDPVVSKYGQSFEREAILEWLLGHSYTCPLTRKPLRLGDLISNHLLRLKIRKWQIENGLDIHLIMDNNVPRNDSDGDEDDDDDDSSGSSSRRLQKIIGILTIPTTDEEEYTERSYDDPNIILEYLPDREATTTATATAPSSTRHQQQQRQRRRRRRSGLFRRIMAHAARSSVTA